MMLTLGLTRKSKIYLMIMILILILILTVVRTESIVQTGVECVQEGFQSLKLQIIFCISIQYIVTENALMYIEILNTVHWYGERTVSDMMYHLSSYVFLKVGSILRMMKDYVQY